MVEMLRPVPVDIEPKRSNLFVLEFPADMGFSEWMVQASSRPNLNIGEITIPFMNSVTYMAGRGAWQPITVAFIEPIGPSATQKIMDWIRQCYETSTGRMGYAVDYKKNLVLKMLDPAGQTIEKWVLYGAFVTSFNPGDLSYNDASLAETRIQIYYDRAILEY